MRVNIFGKCVELKLSERFSSLGLEKDLLLYDNCSKIPDLVILCEDKFKAEDIYTNTPGLYIHNAAEDIFVTPLAIVSYDRKNL